MSKWIEYVTFDGESPMANYAVKMVEMNHGKFDSGELVTKLGVAEEI